MTLFSLKVLGVFLAALLLLLLLFLRGLSHTSQDALELLSIPHYSHVYGGSPALASSDLHLQV